MIGKGQPIGRDGDQNHLNEINDAPAIPVGEQAERQSHQGTRKDRRGDQQAELGFVEPELGLDLDPDDGKHGPHREVDGEGQGVHGKDGILFPFVEFDDRVCHCSKPSGYLGSEARGERAASCRRAQW